MRTKLSACLVGAAAMAALALTGAPAAQAAPSTAPQAAGHATTFTVPAGRNSATVTAGGATVTVVKSVHPSVVVLTCTATASRPLHGAAGVSGLVSVNCNIIAATISVTAAVYHNGTLSSQAYGTFHNASHGYATATAPYQSGQWKTGGLTGYFDSPGNGEFTDETYSATVTL